MSNYRYSTVKRDFEFLYSLSAGGDYADIDASIFDLMANPTKELAKGLYESSIREWFNSARNGCDLSCDVPIELLEDVKVITIGRRYGELDD